MSRWTLLGHYCVSVDLIGTVVFQWTLLGQYVSGDHIETVVCLSRPYWDSSVSQWTTLGQ